MSLEDFSKIRDEASSSSTTKEHKQRDSVDSPLQRVYEKRIVIFTDILGFRNIVQRSSEYFSAAVTIDPYQKELDLADRIRDALQLNIDVYIEAFKNQFNPDLAASDLDLRVSAFSDSVILSVPDNSINFSLALFALSFMVRDLLRNGFLCRGGIAFGEVHHARQDNSSGLLTLDRVFGPAFIKAYDLESQHAGHARIITCNATWKKIQEWGKITECNYCRYIKDNIIKESDGPAKVDILAHYRSKIDDFESIRNELTSIQERIESVIHSYVESPKVFTKLSKFAKEFNELLTELKQDSLHINTDGWR